MPRPYSKTRRSNRSPPGRLRIVAGKWRSRLLPVAPVPGLRPTSERVRETLFNWLAQRIDGARCLDLFAGTGALGFEALSRGAARVDFVEASPVAARALTEAKRLLGAKRADIHAVDAFEFLEDRSSSYDVIFLDPPYDDESLTKLCRLIEDERWVVSGGEIYFEHRKRQSPVFPDTWSIVREKAAGQVRYGLAHVGR